MSVLVRNIEVEDLLGESSRFRVYRGKIQEGDNAIIKIAKTFDDNPVLVDDAKEFSMLKSFEHYLRQFAKFPCADAVNYHLLFAQLFSSFIEESQGDRRMNVYSVPDIDLADMTPLSKLSTSVDMDARSSVWIIGRIFKFYCLFELKRVADDDAGCYYPVFSEHDYLVSPKNHRLVYYNFSGDMYDAYATNIVKSVAEYILKWTVFDSDIKQDMDYYSLLKDFATTGRQTAAKAHSDLYDLVRECWGIHYYPFTYRLTGTTMWKNIEEV